jgi:hypothetical protein
MAVFLFLGLPGCCVMGCAARTMHGVKLDQVGSGLSGRQVIQMHKSQTCLLGQRLL